jgi:hypothetical protein
MRPRWKPRRAGEPQSRWGRRLHAASQWGSRWAGLIGIVTALVATTGTWYQSGIARQHNELSVQPKLRFVPYIEGDGRRNGIYIANVGLGPAEVTGLKLVVAGQHYDLMNKGSHRGVLQAIQANLLCFAESQPVPGFHVKAGDLEPLFVSANNALFNRCHQLVALALMNQPFEFELAYRSIYGRAFTQVQTVSLDKNAIYSRLPVPEPR